MNINTTNKKEIIKHLYNLITEKRKVLNVLDYSDNINKYKDFNLNKKNIIDRFIILSLEKFSMKIKFILETSDLIKKNSIYVFEVIDSSTGLALTIIINIIRYIIYTVNKHYINLLKCNCEDCNIKKSYFNIKELYEKIKSVLNFEIHTDNFVFRIVQSLITLFTVGVLGMTCMEESYNNFNFKY